MNKKPIYINGVGAYLPSRILTNADLEKMVETSDEWIVSRTGIRERHLAAADEFTSDLGTRAAKLALADANVAADEIDFIIVSTVTPDMFFPATACLIQRNLGLNHCPCMDVEAACAGMIYILDLAAALITRGPYRKILCIAADKLSAITDWSDRSTCVLFGDGGSAFVVSGERQNARAELVDAHLCANSEAADTLTLPAGGSRRPASSDTVRDHLHFLHMQGPEVFKHAVKAMSDAAEKILERNQLQANEIHHCIPHQANLRIIEAVARQLKLPTGRCATAVQRTGNTSSGSIGIALNELCKEGQLRGEDLLLLIGFGAGMTSASAILRWLSRD